MKCFFLLFLLLSPFAAMAEDDPVREEIQTLHRRLTELERQVARPPSSRGNEFNPRITAFGDFTGRVDNRRLNNDEGREVSNRMGIRELEVDMRADVDPYAKAVAIVVF